MENKSNNLIIKLDGFIKKYYRNELLKGLLIAGSLAGGLFLLINYSEYFFGFSGTVRMVLFFLLIGALIGVTAYWIIRPLLGFFNIGKHISHEQAAQIIGDHFSEIEDRLLNTLYLQNHKENKLAMAMVEKRSAELSVLSFDDAVDYRTNLKFLRYLLPVLLIGLMTYALFPDILSVGTKRIVNYSVPYEKMAPFTFHLQNDDLEIRKGENVTINVLLEGSSIPDKLKLKTENGAEWRMKSEGNNMFSLVLSSIEQSTNFKFTTEKYESGLYEIKVADAPELLGFKMRVTYPEHLKRKEESFSGVSEIQVPEGSEIHWEFDTRNTQSVYLISDTSVFQSPDLSTRVYDRFIYDVELAGEQYRDTVLRNFAVDVIKDRHPEIEVEMKRDSTSLNTVYFMGEVSDDNGLSKIDAVVFGNRINIEKPKGSLSHRFFHRINLDSLDENKSGVFFEVFDNDVVNNYKSARSQVFFVNKLSEREKSKVSEEKAEQLKRAMEELKKMSDDIDREVQDFQKDLIQKDKLDWQDEKRLEDLTEKMKDFEKKSKDVKKKKEELSELNDQNFEMSEELKEKQRQLDELFEKMMEDEELRELFEEMEKLREEMDKDKLLDKLQDMQFDQEDLSKQLDRELELFKKLELEKDWENAEKQLGELAEKQEELMNDEEMSSEEMKEAQEELNDMFEQLKDDISEMEKRAEELGMDELDVDDEELDSISDDMENAAENAGDGNSDDAKKNQSDAKDKMQKMQDQMNSAMDMQQEATLEMDIEALRMIRQNLIRLSFDQEELLTELKQTKDSDPKYVGLITDQKKIKDDTRVVEDSLEALAKRVFFLEEKISQELKIVKKGLEKTIHHMVEREKRPALVKSREVMTSYNNLALLVGEMLDQMQQQMAQQKFGEGKCNKPGQSQGSKPGKGEMNNVKEQLKKNMEKMKEMLGKQKGEEGEGGEEKGGQQGQGSGMSEQLSKMVGEQQAIRKALREMAAEQQKQEGGGQSKELKEIEKDLEKNEEDLINKQLDIETLRRQQDIMQRMLESEKAMREQDMQEERESKEGKKKQKDVPEEIMKYLMEKEKSADLLRKSPPELNPFYRERVTRYFE